MHRITRIMFAGLLVVAVSTLPVAPATATPVLARVTASHDNAAVDGTGLVLGIHSERHEIDILTAGALFKRADGEPAVDAVQVVIAGQTATVSPDKVILPIGEMSGVAILHVGGITLSADASVVVDHHSPSIGDVFVVSMMNGSESVDVPERVQFVATRLVVGDRALGAAPGCLGAPALSQRGVFGIVMDCSAGRAPVIALLSTARSFLSRHVPQVRQTSDVGLSRRSPFVVTDRLVEGPLMTVACDAVRTGELDVPYQLGRNEKAVSATASFLQTDSLRLADVAVLDVNDRAVHLRFTLVGTPPAPYKIPGSCHEGQALLSVRLNLVVLPQ